MVWLKRIGIVLGAFVVLILVAIASIYAATNRSFNREYSIDPPPMVIPSDSATIAHGRHVLLTRGCADCHGEGLRGNAFMDNPAMGKIVAPNLTPGSGGIGGTFTDADWIRAIRHGVGTDGKPLLLMPAQEYYHLSDRDLSALIAYLKTLPPVDNVPPETAPGPMARALFQFGKMPALVPAEIIPHDAPRPDAPVPGVTAEYGEYLTRGCVGCHSGDLAGGPPVAPGWPPAPSLTGTGELAGWEFAQFEHLLRTGEHPSGRQINPEFMPWTAFGKMTDDELRAIWTYLRTL